MPSLFYCVQLRHDSCDTINFRSAARGQVLMFLSAETDLPAGWDTQVRTELGRANADGDATIFAGTFDLAVEPTAVTAKREWERAKTELERVKKLAKRAAEAAELVQKAVDGTKKTVEASRKAEDLRDAVLQASAAAEKSKERYKSVFENGPRFPSLVGVEAARGVANLWHWLFSQPMLGHAFFIRSRDLLARLDANKSLGSAISCLYSLKPDATLQKTGTDAALSPIIGTILKLFGCIHQNSSKSQCWADYAAARYQEELELSGKLRVAAWQVGAKLVRLPERSTINILKAVTLQACGGAASPVLLRATTATVRWASPVGSDGKQMRMFKWALNEVAQQLLLATAFRKIADTEAEPAAEHGPLSKSNLAQRPKSTVPAEIQPGSTAASESTSSDKDSIVTPAAKRSS
eukprot:SAG31_NODE_4863_length_2901_cov_1.189507_2_plen_408_part_00